MSGNNQSLGVGLVVVVASRDSERLHLSLTRLVEWLRPLFQLVLVSILCTGDGRIHSTTMM